MESSPLMFRKTNSLTAQKNVANTSLVGLTLMFVLLTAVLHHQPPILLQLPQQ
jgi:hypothetical protein